MNNYKVGDRVYYHGEKLKVMRPGDFFLQCLDLEGCVRQMLVHRVKPILKVKNGVICE